MLAKPLLNTRSLVTIGILGLAGMQIGCTTTPGTRTSIWPTKSNALVGSGPTGDAGLAGFAAKTKGQLSTVGNAFSSAYAKTKTAITSPFSASTASTTTSPTTLTGPKSNSIGPEVFVMTGQLNESTGDYKKALDSYSKALEMDPKNVPALLATARLYDRQNERDKAISFYQKTIEIAPSAATFAELGGIYAKSGNLNAAKDELQKAVNLEPKNSNYRSAMAGVLVDLGRSDAALDEMLQVHSPAMAQYQMAYLNFARKNVPATQQYLSAALQIDPNLKPARELMASIGGGQSLQQLAQQGNQWVNQAQNTLQQAASVGNNVSSLWQPAQAGLPNVQPAATTQVVSGVESGAYSLPVPPSSVAAQQGSVAR